MRCAVRVGRIRARPNRPSAGCARRSECVVSFLFVHRAPVQGSKAAWAAKDEKMCRKAAVQRHDQRVALCDAGRMQSNEESIEKYRRLRTYLNGEEIGAAEASEEFLRLRHLYWLLAHRPSAGAEAPRDPPLPPWL